jgi:hypothetical protein
LFEAKLAATLLLFAGRSPASATALMQTPAPQLPPATPQSATVVSLHELRSHCTTCSMRELCLPVGLGVEALQQLDRCRFLAFQTVRVYRVQKVNRHALHHFIQHAHATVEVSIQG